MLQKRDQVSWHFIYNLDKASELKVADTNNIKIFIVIALSAILRVRQTQSSFYCYLWVCNCQLTCNWLLNTNLKFRVNFVKFCKFFKDHNIPGGTIRNFWHFFPRFQIEKPSHHQTHVNRNYMDYMTLRMTRPEQHLTYLDYNLHSEYGGKYVIKVIQHLENIARRNKAVQHYSNIEISFCQPLYFTW